MCIDRNKQFFDYYPNQTPCPSSHNSSRHSIMNLSLMFLCIPLFTEIVTGRTDGSLINTNTTTTSSNNNVKNPIHHDMNNEISSNSINHPDSNTNSNTDCVRKTNRPGSAANRWNKLKKVIVPIVAVSSSVERGKSGLPSGRTSGRKSDRLQAGISGSKDDSNVNSDNDNSKIHVVNDVTGYDMDSNTNTNTNTAGNTNTNNSIKMTTPTTTPAPVKFTEEDSQLLMAYWTNNDMPQPPIYNHNNAVYSSSVNKNSRNKEINANENIDSNMNINKNLNTDIDTKTDNEKEKNANKTVDENSHNETIAEKTNNEKNEKKEENDIYSMQFTPPPIPQYEKLFIEESIPLSLLINKIPLADIIKEKERIEKAIHEEEQKKILEQKKRDLDLLHREKIIKENITNINNKNIKNLKIEKLKNLEIYDNNEKNMYKNFRKARENLEYDLKNQLSAIKERFGDMLLSNSDSTTNLSRTYGVRSTYIPQPIEVNIHFLRAAKNKLIKGKYVIMLTQYESLGGEPIWWSKVGAYGEG